mgnify:CR=1 FL=1
MNDTYLHSCPKCGESARSITVTAVIKCRLDRKREVCPSSIGGSVEHVRLGDVEKVLSTQPASAEFMCGGGHTWKLADK